MEKASTNGFRARAGALTLMYVASSVSRRYLLQMLLEGLLGAERSSDADVRRAEDEGLAEVGRLVEAVGDEGDTLRVTTEGKELLFVSSVLRDWLGHSPRGRLRLGDPAAGRALGALVFGWSTTVVHALAKGPLSLLELTRTVDTVSTEVVIERVGYLEANDLVEVRIGADGKKRYAATKWLREGVAPLAAAARLERHFPAADIVPPDDLDIGAAFLLTMPLIELPLELTGSCRLGVEVEARGRPEVAGVTAQVADGRVLICEPELDEGADSFAIGSALDWFDTLVQPEVSGVRTGGAEALAPGLLDALHETLFGSVRR